MQDYFSIPTLLHGGNMGKPVDVAKATLLKTFFYTKLVQS